MELKSDIVCKGKDWYRVGHGYGYNEKPKFFDTFWASFKLCMAIGILYDKQMDDVVEFEEEEKMNLPRMMFNRHSDEMKFFFQTAILSSNCVEFSEKDRLYLAFSEDVSEDELEGDDYEVLTKGITKEALEFDRVLFLKKFANYGATKLAEQLSEIDSETMENLATFLVDSYNGETEELVMMREVETLMDEEYLEEEFSDDE